MESTNDTPPHLSVNSSPLIIANPQAAFSPPIFPSDSETPSTSVLASPLISSATRASLLTSKTSSNPDSSDSTSSKTSNRIVLVETPKSMKKALQMINSQGKIALICEGLRVSRRGRIDLVCVGLRNGKIYLFNLAEHNEWLITGLRGLLESDGDPVRKGGKGKEIDKVRQLERRNSNDSTISLPEVRLSKIKLMFDCRFVSDALLHRHRLRLDGVLDLQLLEVVHRRKLKLNHELLRDSEECLQAYANNPRKKFVKRMAIDEIQSLISRGLNPWAVRPLSTKLIDKLKADVDSIFSLYDALKRQKSSDDMALVMESSKRYANYFRSYNFYPKKEFYRNAYVPHNILLWTQREVHDPPMKCDGCLKTFGLSEMSRGVMKGAMLCAVCIKVVRKIKSKTGAYPEIGIEHDSQGANLTVLTKNGWAEMHNIPTPL